MTKCCAQSISICDPLTEKSWVQPSLSHKSLVMFQYLATSRKKKRVHIYGVFIIVVTSCCVAGWTICPLKLHWVTVTWGHLDLYCSHPSSQRRCVQAVIRWERHSQARTLPVTLFCRLPYEMMIKAFISVTVRRQDLTISYHYYRSHLFTCAWF